MLVKCHFNVDNSDDLCSRKQRRYAFKQMYWMHNWSEKDRCWSRTMNLTWSTQQKLSYDRYTYWIVSIYTVIRGQLTSDWYTLKSNITNWSTDRLGAIPPIAFTVRVVWHDNCIEHSLKTRASCYCDQLFWLVKHATCVNL